MDRSSSTDPMLTTSTLSSLLRVTPDCPRRGRVGTLVALLVATQLTVAPPPVAHAQEASDANALIDQGVERRRAGDDEAALELFTRAWEASRAPRARAQMALVEQALGHFVDAEAHLLEALAVTDDPWIVLRRADLALALEAIQLRLGYLEVRGGIEGADVRLDGRSIGTLPLDEPIRLPAGSYRMEVIARQHYPFARQITIVPEGTTRETVVLTQTPLAPPSEGTAVPHSPLGTTDDESGGSARPVLGAALLGGGGVMLVTSAVTFALRQRRATDYNSDDCLVGGATRGETCGGLYDGALRAQRASAATLSLGVGLAVAGSLMFILGSEPPDESATPAATVQVACGASFGANWGAQCRLRF